MSHKRYFIRELAASDVEPINEWRSDRELINKLGANFRHIDKDVDKNWLSSYLNNRNTNVRLAVCSKESRSIIGVVYLLSIDWLNRNCEFAIMIGDKNHRGKGAGKFATEEALKHAFLDLNLHRVSLSVLDSNQGAIGLYKKYGFKKEGVQRDVVFKDGCYRNMIYMSILSSEYSSS